MTKLTLSLDKKTIEKAKKIAKKNNTSISKMVSEYFDSLGRDYSSEKSDTPILNELSGILSHKANKWDYKKIAEDEIRKKHR